MFYKMPLLLLAMMLAIWLGHPWIPQDSQSIIYAISLTLKSLIIFILPFLIFGLLFKTAVQLAQKATSLILFLLAFVCISNFLSTFLSYGVGLFAYGLDLSMSFPEEAVALIPAWDWSLPKYINNDTAMFSGLGLGIFTRLLSPVFAQYLSQLFERSVAVILRMLTYIIPFFIAGFVLKMCHEGTIMEIFSQYTRIFLIIAVAAFSYITLLYFLASGLRPATCCRKIRNMLPAAMVGFGSMSSAAAMPLTLLGTEKNAKTPELAKAIIPATVNVHLIGDCFAIPIFALAILKCFDLPAPDFSAYMSFAAYFVLAKFSVAAVPGGGILVMLPILENSLHFDPAMLSLITALYILFDPVITSANVMGNGGFAILVEKMLLKVAKKPVFPGF